MVSLFNYFQSVNWPVFNRPNLSLNLSSLNSPLCLPQPNLMSKWRMSRREDPALPSLSISQMKSSTFNHKSGKTRYSEMILYCRIKTANSIQGDEGVYEDEKDVTIFNVTLRRR